MSDQSRDRDLEALYEGLRAEDGKGVPDFASMMAKARQEAGQEESLELAGRDSALRRLFVRPRIAWAGGALAAAAAAVLMFAMPDRSDAHFEEVVRSFATSPATGGWTSPTDRLLQVPGLEFVSTLPSIGGFSLPSRSEDRPSSQL